MDQPDLVRLFARDQRRRGLAETTVAVRGRLLAHFTEWLPDGDILAVKSDDVEGFLDSRRAKPASRALYLSHLRVFYQWALLGERTDRDPTVGIRSPKKHRGLPRPISDHDLSLALDKAEGKVLVVLALAAYGGLRCVEISRACREDVLLDRRPPVILVHGKGNKDRLVPLHPVAADAMDRLPMPRRGFIVRDEHGCGYPAWGISKLGNEFLHELGFDWTAHQLRHWFASAIYRASGHDLLLTADLLGHESVETTRIYARFDRTDAAAAVATLDPRR